MSGNLWTYGHYGDGWWVGVDHISPSVLIESASREQVERIVKDHNAACAVSERLAITKGDHGLIFTAATHLLTWATSTNKTPYQNTLEVAKRLEALGNRLSERADS